MDKEAIKKMCRELIGYCRDYPGIQVVVVAGYDYWLGEFFTPALFQTVNQDSHEFEYDVKAQSLLLWNGSRLRWKSYDSPEMIKGWDAHVIWFARDSYQGDNKDKVFQIEGLCHTRLRANKPPYPTRWIVSPEREEA